MDTDEKVEPTQSRYESVNGTAAIHTVVGRTLGWKGEKEGGGLGERDRQRERKPPGDPHTNETRTREIGGGVGRSGNDGGT